MIVKAKVAELAKQAEVRVSAEFNKALSERVAGIVINALEAVKKEGVKTLKARHLPSLLQQPANEEAKAAEGK